VSDRFFAANGDLHVTGEGLTGLHDPTGRLFRVSENGKVTCLIDNVPGFSGLVMIRDESALYRAVTCACAVWRLPFKHDGDVVRSACRFCDLEDWARTASRSMNKVAC
jgi:gluconolactonase